LAKKILIILSAFFSILFTIFIFTIPSRRQEIISPYLYDFQKERPLDRYGFENLRKREYPGSKIKFEKIISEEKTYISWLFSYQSDGKRITGMANLPKVCDGFLACQSKLPVVVMLRGYVDEKIYFTGLGTRKAAGVFAENGFLTLAPDFLGFGGSDSQSADILEARFYRPVEVLNLLSSIKNLPQANPKKIFLWGHSNGGQIALSVLEISQKAYPTVLWAPVTHGFPQAVFDYLGELDDQGLKVKEAIDKFLEEYNPEKYSVDNYFLDIQAPIQVHQGENDQLVKISWTDEFVAKMESLGKKIVYFKYPQNDHNLKQSWDLVVQRDIEFFRRNLHPVE